jgi:hypothetical protein
MIFYCPMLGRENIGDIHRDEAAAIQELADMGYDTSKLTRGDRGILSPLFDAEQNICVSIIRV